MEKKYKITVRGTDGKTEVRIGVGKPMNRGGEILVKSPDGKEIIFISTNIQSFVVEEYSD